MRAGGAVPATIAVMGGVICAGLSDTELEWLATAKNVLKLSRNDLPYALATKKIGATTVAATMICAQLAGIKVFATGGIGGVHRGADVSFDISADLEELARTPVAVVCAGAKALLDLPKTLEYLETRGVPVIGYGTDEFPAFWSRRSGLKAPLRLDTAGRSGALPQGEVGAQSGRRRHRLQPRAGGRRDSGAGHARLHRFGRTGSRRVRHQGQGRDAVHSGAHCRTLREAAACAPTSRWRNPTRAWRRRSLRPCIRSAIYNEDRGSMKRILLLALCALTCGAQELKVYAIDVEGGKATLYVSPSGQSMLVDAGYTGFANRDADRIVAAANAAGVKTIDYLVITHYHADHVGGVAQLAAKMPIRHFVDHGENFESRTRTESMRTTWRSGRRVLTWR